MNLKIKNFLYEIKNKFEKNNYKVDATIFDFDNYEDYLNNIKDDNNLKVYFSVNTTKPYYSISFEIDTINETVSLVSSDGYNFSPLGKPQDINQQNIYTNIELLTKLLLK